MVSRIGMEQVVVVVLKNATIQKPAHLTIDLLFSILWYVACAFYGNSVRVLRYHKSNLYKQIGSQCETRVTVGGGVA